MLQYEDINYWFTIYIVFVMFKNNQSQFQEAQTTFPCGVFSFMLLFCQVL